MTQRNASFMFLLLGLGIFLYGVSLGKDGGKVFSSSPLGNQLGDVAELRFQDSRPRELQACIATDANSHDHLMIDAVRIEFELTKQDSLVAAGRCPPYTIMRWNGQNEGVLSSFKTEVNANYHLTVRVTDRMDGRRLSICFRNDPEETKEGVFVAYLAIPIGLVGLVMLYHSRRPSKSEA